MTPKEAPSLDRLSQAIKSGNFALARKGLGEIKPEDLDDEGKADLEKIRKALAPDPVAVAVAVTALLFWGGIVIWIYFA